MSRTAIEWTVAVLQRRNPRLGGGGPVGERAPRAAAPRGPFTDGPASVESGVSALQAGYRHLIGDLAGEAAAGRRAAELEAAGTAQWRAEGGAAPGAHPFLGGPGAPARPGLGATAPP